MNDAPITLKGFMERSGIVEYSVRMLIARVVGQETADKLVREQLKKDPDFCRKFADAYLENETALDDW